MRRSGTTTTFILVCIAVLLASYGIGLGIRQFRFRNAGNQSKISDETEKQNTAAQTSPQRGAMPPAGSDEAGGPERGFSGRERPGGGPQDGETDRRRRFENMSEEEMSQMRRRSGRRGPGGGMGFENLSEEERAAMEERRRQRMERFENMTEEERAQFRREREEQRQEDNMTDDTSDPGPEENDSE